MDWHNICDMNAVKHHSFSAHIVRTSVKPLAILEHIRRANIPPCLVAQLKGLQIFKNIIFAIVVNKKKLL